MRTITLQEEQTHPVAEADLSQEAILRFLRKFPGKFDVEFPNIRNHWKYSIRSRGYIGFVLLEPQVGLQVKPKVPINNVFCMLEYAYGLKSFELKDDGTIFIDTVEDIFEQLATVLAKRVLARNRKGLYRGYRSHREALPAVRGRIDVLATFMSLNRGFVHAVCEYEEHTADLEDNQILAWTLYSLRHTLFSEQTRHLISRAFREISHKVKVVPINGRDCVDRLYHRLNDDYRPMHGLCRFFLEYMGPGIQSGNNDFIPFLLNMPRLFEAFVAEWLHAHLPPSLSLRKQARTKLDQESKLEFKVDLVILDTETQKTLCIIDTKYKREALPDVSDIAQVTAYAVKMNTVKAVLLYPSFVTRQQSLEIGAVTVMTRVLDIGSNPEEAGKDFLERLLVDMT